MEKIVSVFTPTYNRERTITALFNSLLAQTNKSFEWIIVDNGNDNTGKLINAFKKEADFPVYYYKLNGERGISRAFNLMLSKANGFLVFKADDDDRLQADAIETILKLEETISSHKEEYAGVAGLRAYPNGEIIGGEWTNAGNYVDATNIERPKYGLTGDKAEAYYLDVLKKYGPMPTVPGEFYTWEGVLWDRIAHAGLKIRWANQAIYITEYLPDGATANRAKAKKENFGTYTILVSERLSYKEIPLYQRLILSCRYFELARQKNIKFGELKERFSASPVVAKLGCLLSVLTKIIPSKNKKF